MIDRRRGRRAIACVVALAACGKGDDRKPDHHAAAAEKSFALSLTSLQPPGAGAPIDLTFELLDPAGVRVTRFDVVHEKLLHLIVVSDDLSFFTHEHPALRPNGLWLHQLTLPQPGAYTVYADFTPTGGRNTVVSAPLVVEGAAPAAVALAPVALPATARDGRYTVELKPEEPLAAGGSTMLDVTVTDGAGPVTDLQPYLGAKGHCVIISADRTNYVHSHPMGGEGATVAFHTAFPAPGVYKLWVELRPRGETLRVSFTVDVPASARR